MSEEKEVIFDEVSSHIFNSHKDQDGNLKPDAEYQKKREAAEDKRNELTKRC